MGGSGDCGGIGTMTCASTTRTFTLGAPATAAFDGGAAFSFAVFALVAIVRFRSIFFGFLFRPPKISFWMTWMLSLRADSRAEKAQAAQRPRRCYSQFPFCPLCFGVCSGVYKG
jgi:hypothetical protein